MFNAGPPVRAVLFIAALVIGYIVALAVFLARHT